MTSPVRIERSVSLSWDQDAAFSRLAADPMMWWPWNPRDVRGERARRIGFEQRAGGVVFQESADGKLSELGEVREWDPPHRITLAYRPPAQPSLEESVVLTFDPQQAGTRLTFRGTSRRNPWRPRKEPHTLPAFETERPLVSRRTGKTMLYLVRALILVALGSR